MQKAYIIEQKQVREYRFRHMYGGKTRSINFAITVVFFLISKHRIIFVFYTILYEEKTSCLK